MIDRIDPQELEGRFPSGGTITIYGRNLTKLPDEVCLNCAPSKKFADEYIDATLGIMEAMPVRERDDNHIVFYRPLPTDADLSTPHYPIYLTTPYDTPRSVIYELQRRSRYITPIDER